MLGYFYEGEEITLKNTGKKLLCIALALVMALGMMTCAFAADTGAKAVVSAQTLYVNGANSTCEKYNIDGYNYFKLRDLAALLSGTDYQFEVAVNGDERIVEITTGKAYTAVGGELAVGEDMSATCVTSAWKLTVDGKAVDAKAYNLGGNNYFKLRDLGDAIGFAVDYDQVSNASVVTAQKGVAYIHVNDGATKLTDELFNKYFDGDAKAGVEALLAAGKVSINGIPLPKTEDELTVYNINKFEALYKGENGWGYKVHKTEIDPVKPFAEARLGLAEMVSTVCGHTTTLYVGADGKVESINMTNVESVLVTDRSNFNESTHVKRGDFQLETNRGERPDVNNEVFPTAYFDQSLEIGEFGTYKYGPNGWEMDRALCIRGTIQHTDSVAGGKGYIINGTDARRESNVSRYNLRNYNRPTQFWDAYSALGLTDVAVNIWCTSTGHPIGFTYGENGRAALKQAINFAKAARDAVVVSEDGEDVAAGKKWIAAEDLAAFDEAIAAAETIAKKNSAAIYDFDEAIYKLYTAYGTDGAKRTGFLGALGEGSGAPEQGDKEPTSTGVLESGMIEGNIYQIVNDGSTTLTDAKYDSYYKEGTAKAGVEALLNAGKVYINGIALPKTEGETEMYNINNFQALYKGDKGWGYEVHKTKTDTNMSFADARIGLIEMVSTVCGHTTKLYLGADGKVEKIDASNVESVFVTDIISHGVTTEIKRGEFQLETNRGARPDVNDIAFAINDEVEIGDMVYYYYGADGWVCFKAPSVTGTIEHSDSIAGGKGYIINGTDARRESNVSRYNLRNFNRPTQFWNAYSALGLTEIAVNVWCTSTGNPIGFSYGTNGKAAMKKAVETCKAALEGVVISEDGEGLAAGTRWIAQEYMTEFQTALAAAEKYSKSNAIGVCEWDQYIYELAAALGTDNAKKPSGFLGNIGIA